MRKAATSFRPIAGLALAACVLLACGTSTSVVTSNTAVPTKTSTPAPSAQMTAVTVVQSVANSGASGPVTATASCPSGQVMLSGGYALTGGANVQPAAVQEDYPASTSAWTVTVLNTTVGGSLTLTVYADCPHANFAVTTQIVANPQTVPNDASLHTLSAMCPAGTSVTGGGYRDSGFGSGPTGNGWQATYIPRGENPPATARLYAVCASSALQAAAPATTTQPVAQGATGSATVACPAGQLQVGGGYGYSGTPSFAYTDAPTSGFAGWQIQLADQGIPGGPGGAGTLTASAVCMHIP